MGIQLGNGLTLKSLTIPAKGFRELWLTLINPFPKKKQFKLYINYKSCLSLLFNGGDPNMRV